MVIIYVDVYGHIWLYCCGPLDFKKKRLKDACNISKEMIKGVGCWVSLYKKEGYGYQSRVEQCTKPANLKDQCFDFL